MPQDNDNVGQAQDLADDGPPSADARDNVSSAPDTRNAEAPTAVPADAASAQSAASAAPEVELDAAEDIQKRLWDMIRTCTACDSVADGWKFLGIADHWLRIDMPPREFVEVLAQTYSADELCVLRFCERVDGELRLPSWLEGDAPLFAAYDEDKQLIDFSRGKEFLFPMRRTALDYALERTSPDSPQAPVTLYILDSHSSVEIMQRLGLPAVSWEGLEVLGRQDIEKMFSGDPRSDFDWRYYLLLVDFDVAPLDNRPTAAIGEVIQRLADAADVYGIDPARRFGVCRPSAREFHVLERATTFEDSVQICRLFEKWAAAAKTEKINSWRVDFNSEVASYAVASAALTRALHLSDNFLRRVAVSAALPAYRAAGQAAVITKFHQAIDAASNPFDQVDLIAAAAYSETFFESDPLVRAGESVLAGRTPPSVQELQDELFAQRQKCMVELRRIRRDRKTNR